MKKGFLFFTLLLMMACSKTQQVFEQRVDAAVKLCQSDSAKAYSHTADGLRVVCHNGSSYLIRNDLSLEEIVELDENYCSSMGIKELIAENDGSIALSCKDGASYIL